MIQYPGIGCPPDSQVSLQRKICNNLADIGEAIINGTGGGSITVPLYTKGYGYSASSTKTRSANLTPYPALSVVSSDPASYEQFDDIGPSAGGKVLLTMLKLRWDAASIAAGMGYFRLHLYNAAPTPIADNAAFNLIAGDRDKYLGFIELPPPLDLGDTLYTETEAMNYAIRKEVTVESGGILYGILQTVNSFTPASAVTRELTLIAVGV